MLVVLTREAGFNDELIRWVGDAGEVVEAPLTTTAYRDVADVAKDIAASGLDGSFATLVVTSVRARPYVGVAVAALAPGARVASVGRRTSQMLGDEGVHVDVESESGALDLAGSVGEGPVLFVAAREARARARRGAHRARRRGRDGRRVRDRGARGRPTTWRGSSRARTSS